MANKKIVMIIATEGFRDEEFFIPYEKFKEEGFDVDVAARKKGLCKGKLGRNFEANKSIDEINMDDYDALVLVGGMGSLENENYEVLHNLIKEALDSGKVVGSICISPRILIAAGVLNGKKFTMWNADNSQDSYIARSGGIYTGKNVEVDGNLITANGPHAAAEYALEIIKKLNKNR